MTNNRIFTSINIFIAALLFSLSFQLTYASPPYLPGETLDPDCGPSDPDCKILIPKGAIFISNGKTLIAHDVKNLFWDVEKKYLGIRTNMPNYAVDINGDLRVSGGAILSKLILKSGAGEGFVLTSDESGVATWKALPKGVSGVGEFGFLPVWSSTSSIGKASELYWDFSGGKLGIGVLTPLHKLDVSGYIRGTGLCIGNDCRISWPSGGGGGGIGGSGTANYIALWTSSGSLGDSVIFQNQGNIGIGTTTLPEKFTVAGNMYVSGKGIFASSPLTVGNLTLSTTGLSASRTFTFPDVSDTLVSVSATQTLVQKTLSSPTIQGVVSPGTGLTMPAFVLSGNITGSGNPNISGINEFSGNKAIFSNFLSTTLLNTPAGDLTIDPTGDVIVVGSGADNLTFALRVRNSNALPLLYVRNDGNLGVGTSTPLSLLHLSRTDASVGLIYQLSTNNPGGSSSQGPNSPQSVVSDSSTGTITWIDPLNATSSDNSYASAEGINGQISYYLKSTNFAFNIPSDATIDGIMVEIERHEESSTTGSVFDAEVRLVKNGVVSGDNKANTSLEWPLTDAYQSYGGSNDLWGLTFTPSDINNTGFGVALAVRLESDLGVVAKVDHVRITVYFTTAGGLTAEWISGIDQTDDGKFKISRALQFGSQDYFTITKTGSIGIGTSTPSYKLDVQGDIRQTSATNCSLVADLFGKITCSPSLKRFKKDLGELDFNLEKFLSLPIHRFEWLEGELEKEKISMTGSSVGFFAEEVAVLFPELARYDASGNLAGVKTDLLGFYLFRALKEQQKQLNQLFTELGHLESNISNLGLALKEDGTLSVRSIEVERGVTIFDEETKEPYCIKVRQGEIFLKQGKCNEM